MVDDRVQSRRASRRRSQDAFGEALGEDLVPPQDSLAAEAASDHQEVYNPSQAEDRSRAVDSSLCRVVGDQGFS